MSGFSKLYGSIVHSTVWREPHTTRIVWITMLALADAGGYVGASLPGLADAARVTREECEAALGSFLAPDPDSRSKDHDGRRIEIVDGGWVLLNYAAYRAGRDPEVRRQQNRDAQARYRDRQPRKPDVSQAQPISAHAEAEAEAEADQDPPVSPPAGDDAAAPLSTPTKVRKRKPNATSRPEDWKPTKAHQDYAATHGLDVQHEAPAFCAHHDSKGNLFVSWDSAFTTWLANQARWDRRRAPAPGLREHAERTGAANVERPVVPRSSEVRPRVATLKEALSPDYQAAIPSLSAIWGRR